jgi:hypothetical protein
MRALFILLTLLWSISAFALSCDCEVMIYAPLTGSHSLPPTTLKTYEQEEFNAHTPKSHLKCRESCEKRFQEDMTHDKLTALLLLYSSKLIDEKVLGYNCTGLTNLKYPVRVKAILGSRSLGNVADFVHSANFEQSCF